ncbi:hypothetical protein HJ041_23100 [Vibrio parahaemolyticus]|nr:hypothetical protein [Vibrio parahaemolyticus]
MVQGKGDILEIRYVVEQRCKKHDEHRGLLGAIPVTSDPRRLEEILITGVVSCNDCSFHSKFYDGDGCITLVPKKTKSENQKLLNWLIGTTLLLAVFSTVYTAQSDVSYLYEKSFTMFLALLVSGINAFISVLERKASTHSKIANILSLILSLYVLNVVINT